MRAPHRKFDILPARPRRRTVTPIALVRLVLALSTILCSSQPARAADYVDVLGSKNTRWIVQKYREFIAAHPENTALHIHLAARLRDIGQTEAELTELRAAIELQPGNLAPYYRLHVAEVLLESRKFEEALRELRVLHDFEGPSAAVSSLIGQVYYGLGRLDDALAATRDASELVPTSSIPHAALAAIQLKKRQKDAALAELRLAVKIDPDDDYSHYQLGSLLADTGQLTLAIEELKEAVRIDPRSSTPHQKMAAILERLGRSKESKIEADKGNELLRNGLRQDERIFERMNNLRPDDVVITAYDGDIAKDPKDGHRHAMNRPGIVGGSNS